jgi:hypothetical protein
MSKPQVNINLNVDVKIENTTSDDIKCQLDQALAQYDYVMKQVSSHYTKDTDTTIHLRPEQPTSRHHQSVAANVRIMDAIEFINKEIRLLKGNQDSGALKVLKEVHHILLDI